MDTAALGTILSVWAHPDDETYLAGGLMAAAAERGQRVVCVTATAGEHGTTDPRRWPPTRLGPVRRLEADAAMAVLGVREHRVLGLPDGSLDACDPEGVATMTQLLAEVRPDTVLTFGADGMTFHPDHRAVHRWVTETWRRSGCRGRLLQAAMTRGHLARFGELYERWGMYMTDERPDGVADDAVAIHLRLEGFALDRKLTALRAMATQTAEVMAAVDAELFASTVAEECFVDAGDSR